jgi:nucleotide-binding universal stress UspA family protein
MNITMVVGKGDPGTCIIDYIEKDKACALIIGSRSLGVVKRAILGSVGDFCVHNAHCPVLIIKHPNA